jgi:hypothetical protein
LPGDPAWWQAFTGLIQAILAFAVFYVTHKYVRLTAQLVQLQASVVALQQQSERRESYERRVEVYDALMTFLAEFIRDAGVEFSSIQRLYRDTRQAEFLFASEIPAFIEKVARAANEHLALDPEAAAASGNAERLARAHELELWLVSPAVEEAKEKFGHYLRLTAPIATEGETQGQRSPRPR